MNRNTLANPLLRHHFHRWITATLTDPEQLDRIDLPTEFGDDLTFPEAKAEALRKFPGAWKVDEPQRAREIIFIEPLVTLILQGQVQVTYRKTPKSGAYYVITSRFLRSGDPRRQPRLLLQFHQQEKVDPNVLTDAEAQLAGIPTATEIQGLFRAWYGDPLPPLWRNWFTVVA